MIIYHFCAKRDLKSILRTGIYGGMIVEWTDQGYRMQTGWTWLTLDPDPKRQSWATSHIIPYDRTACRLTVDIPEDMLSQLYDRDGVAEIYPCTVRLFDGWAGSENWRVFDGIVPREWIQEWVLF